MMQAECRIENQVWTINSYRKDDVSILTKHQKCGRTNCRYPSCIILAPTGDGGSEVQDMVTCSKPHRGNEANCTPSDDKGASLARPETLPRVWSNAYPQIIGDVIQADKWL